MSTVSCPHCGAEIASDASFCRHCGSSESDGWREESWDGDDEDFDYDDYVETHHGSGMTNRSVAPLWRLVAFILLLCFFAWALLIF